MTKRIIALIMCTSITVAFFSSCSSKGQDNKVTTQSVTQVVTDDTSFKLSFTQSDSLDPFKAKTLNNQVLSSLVFEPLFDIDTSYKVQPNIALKYEYTDSKTIEVTINNGLTFNDGSPLTAEDVVYSAKAAMKSPAYGTSLSAISSVSADSETLILFHLKYADPYAQNLLTFPIASTDDDKDGFPVGSGRYSYSLNGSSTCLKANVTDTFFPHFTTINLMNIAASDSIDNAVNIGNISFAFRDMSSNTALRMTSAKKPVVTNNIVFIGLNSNSGLTSNTDIRRAISLAVDRTAISKSAYADYALPAVSIFNPACSLSKDTEIFSGTADTSAARQAIAQSGVDPGKLKISLLVNENTNRSSAANLIKNELEAVGFSVKINSVKYSKYKSSVQNGNFEMYIGETKLADDMCLNPFFTSSGAVHYGINLDGGKTDNNYKSYLKGDKELGAFILSFNEEMPFVPLLYHKGMICYSKSLSGDMQGYYGNFFSNIQDWYFDN